MSNESSTQPTAAFAVPAQRAAVQPLVAVTFVLAAVTAWGIYSNSEQLLKADNHLAFYSLLAAPGIGVVALVALVRRNAVGAASMKWYAGVLAAVGIVVMLFQAVHAWGVLTGAPPWCEGNSRCSDGIGRGFLHLSWLDWMAIATYFGGIASATSSR